MILLFCFKSRWKEFTAVLRLAAPSMLIYFLETSVLVVSLIFQGRLGKGDLSAGAIALAYFNIVWYFIEGVLTAQDALCATAYGRRDHDSLRYWTYVSLFICVLLCTAGTIIFLFAPLFIRPLFGVNQRTATKVSMIYKLDLSF